MKPALSAATFAAALLTAPASAVRSADTSPYTQYVRARAADVAGMTDRSAEQYGAALAASPGDMLLATRTYRQALMAGNEALAVKAAILLDSGSALPPDGRLLLLGEQVKSKDWKAARATVDRVEREQSFGFLMPIVKAWVAFGSGGGDPLLTLSKSSLSGLASAYTTEHRALILLAMGRQADAVTVIKASATGSQVRDVSLRMLAAQSLAAKGNRQAAIALLQGDDPVIVALRRQIDAGKKVAAPTIDTAFGLSQLLIRVAIDINRERTTPMSPSLARIATFIAPKNADAWLITAQLLSLGERYDTALDALNEIPENSPVASSVRATRIRILVSKGAKADALAVMQTVIAKPDATVADWTLLGDVYNGLDRPADAARAYGRAIDLAGANASDNDQLGSLWLLKGSALDQTGAWPEARTALEKALAFAPDQPVVLNYLGYAQLERRENIKTARELIERASKLRPDDAAITDSLGWAHYLAGDFETAIAKLETAAVGDPGGSEINEHLGDAYWATGRRIEARYAWRAALVTADEKASPRLARKIDFGLDKSGAAP